MRLLGFVPDDVVTAPETVVEFVAAQVEAAVKDLPGYSGVCPADGRNVAVHLTTSGRRSLSSPPTVVFLSLTFN